MSENTIHETPNTKRKKLLIGFTLIVIIIGVLVSLYWFMYASHFVSTDNAYTAVETAQITPAIDGTIREILVTDTQSVKAGDILVKIDPIDTKSQLDQAKANLDSAIRRVQGYIANDGNLQAQITAKEADAKRVLAQLQASQADKDKAAIDLKRREALIGSGSVSQDELTLIQNAYTTAKSNFEALQATSLEIGANLKAAQYAKKINDALIQGTTEESHPEVLAARAKLDQAEIDFNRTIIKSPIDGIVSKRYVQLGQRVQQGMNLLSVVPITKIHVDANFKEVQLPKVNVGQKAIVYSDLYGKHVIYHGIVEGFSGGTGAAFSAIPAQNATGNWIKVVQRIPVRIQLDEDELKEHPLRVGLSMNVEIDTTTNSRKE
ncbi:Multidrug resistance efflux pump EmrA [Sulfurospirillum diekertiae]|uniref:Multidrug resistance efflux pump EmrA n=1 Tax=Sulfurospirillum diekertiae TaxID=1854492 RepID=A0A290HTG3_9BACT|nr:HlyD family secretion protein [Sulfurospirillum diekertiae]ATB69924.1 Multidrug resistance efflux pump EmrA [Sulfurospirillum diekertiae]